MDVRALLRAGERVRLTEGAGTRPGRDGPAAEAGPDAPTAPAGGTRRPARAADAGDGPRPAGSGRAGSARPGLGAAVLPVSGAGSWGAAAEDGPWLAGAARAGPAGSGLGRPIRGAPQPGSASGVPGGASGRAATAGRPGAGQADRPAGGPAALWRRMAVACALALVAASPVAAEPVVPRIVVSGEGRTEAVPDMASLQIGVASRAETPGEALQAASEATREVLERMAALGIAPRDLQTTELALEEVWHHDRSGEPPQLVGYEARNRVLVRLRDLSDLGGVVDAAVTGGATRFDGLQFGLSQPQAAAAADEARRRAVADALAKAQLYAEAAGVTLGPVRSLVEDGASGPRPPMMRSADMALEAAVPVAAGELEVTARVRLEFGPPD